MKNTILFHATTEELQKWLSRWIVRFGFHVVGKTFSPQGRVFLPRSSDSAIYPDPDFTRFHELILGQDIEKLSAFAADLKSFDYPPGFRFMFPRMTDEGLRSGSLDLIRKEPVNLDIWKALVADVRNYTASGMWVHIKFNGLNAFDKDLRYTPGIVDLTRQGVRLLPFAGGNPVTIDEPQEQPQHDVSPGTGK